ncbi:radical SAM protein [Rubrivivax gelatinosus]|uniref:Nitrogen fixation protein NifB n=1 Tax=Rubrivivax gelatinosus TaxID=28068 RepID=A0ABS1E1N0_RUBGE|nr:radical SAM protein [Rubrivivax gelatinosus]MBK1715780.1 nitrogen fixation protein NifB [Rubrivivax gelatinosus]
MSTLKERLYDEWALKAELTQDGVGVHPEVLRRIALGSAAQENVNCLFSYNRELAAEIDVPPYFILPHGLIALFHVDRRANWRLEHDGRGFYVVDRDGRAVPVRFPERPGYYARQTSDGTPMRTVAVHNSDGVVFVAYSNECSLQATSRDCLFCNINATAKKYGEVQGVKWKYPRQIGETVAAAYAEGARHLTISGGFVPERREVDYYLDVADEIRAATGLDDFNGTACIGAPRDLDVIAKYREAGFRTLAINIEVWNEHFFRAYCPGKEQECGGRDHWVRALEHAVEVFGRHRVRSNMVGGLESKESTLEGIEILAGKGVVAISPGWIPNPGSALEGHRSPEPEWHLDVARKTYRIYQKVGIGFDQLYDATAVPQTLVHDLFRIEEERLPVFAEERAKESVAA